MKKAFLIPLFLILLAFNAYGQSGRNFAWTAEGWRAPDKDPAGVLDYEIDWSAWLSTDTIATSTWTAGTGITAGSESKTATATTIWLSGGTVATKYKITNTITTAGGRTTAISFVVYVRYL